MQHARSTAMKSDYQVTSHTNYCNTLCSAHHLYCLLSCFPFPAGLVGACESCDLMSCRTGERCCCSAPSWQTQIFPRLALFAELRAYLAWAGSGVI